MRPGAALWLARTGLAADRRGAVLDAAAAAVGAAALVFFVALGLGVSGAARRLFPADARLVEVVPAKVSLGALLGGGRLDDAALARLAALPGTAAAWPRLTLRVPLAASELPGGLSEEWPRGMTLQIPVTGLDPGLVAADVGPGERFADPGPGGVVPVMLSRRLLEVYDRAIAPSWGVRRLPQGVSFVGVEARVKLGLAIVEGRTEPRVETLRIRLAGLSDRVPLYLLAMPLDAVRRFHREYGKADEGYTSVTLLARSAEEVPALAAAVRRMGFSVDEGERQTAERVGSAMAVTTGALALVALLMCALAALAIARSLSARVRARARENAILQALGATPDDVARVVVAEALLVGLGGGAVGAALAALAAVGVDAAAARWLGDLPLRPDTFFAFPAWLPPLGVLVAAVSAVTGALGPALAAARVDPARTIA